MNTLSCALKTAVSIRNSVEHFDRVSMLDKEREQPFGEAFIIDEWEKELRLALFDVSNAAIRFSEDCLSIVETREALKKLREKVEG